MKDVLSKGRIGSTKEEAHQPLMINGMLMEMREIHINPVHNAGIQVAIRAVQKFPTYLLEPRNTMKGTIMERSFGPIAPPALVTLFWVQELQQNSKISWPKIRMAYMLAELSKSGGLVKGIYKVLSECTYQMYCSQQVNDFLQ